jgi:hypothetical protein
MEIGNNFPLELLQFTAGPGIYPHFHGYRIGNQEFLCTRQ